jgi:hypothetical protein
MSALCQKQTHALQQNRFDSSASSVEAPRASWRTSQVGLLTAVHGRMNCNLLFMRDAEELALIKASDDS